MIWLWVLVGAAGAALVAGGFYAWRRRRLRRGRAAFHRDQLHTVVAAGATTATSVRLWGRAAQVGRQRLQLDISPCERPFDATRSEPSATQSYEVELSVSDETDRTFVVDFPSDVRDAPPLLAGTAYRCEIRGVGGGSLGVAWFETAPGVARDVPRKFAIGAMSCHLPFDDYGFRKVEADRLLNLVPEILRSYDVKRVLMMGDQVYGDLPEACSLLDERYFRLVAPPHRPNVFACSRAEVRTLYQTRHRIFWASRAMQDIQRRFVCHMILDDHEIFDNVGSAQEHASPRYRNLIDGATDAFHDYQASRVFGATTRPRSFHHQLDFGTLSIFVMDLRSERQATQETLEMYSSEQLQALEEFLDSRRAQHVVGIVVSVPIVHVPDWVATVGGRVLSMDGDANDRWSTPRATASRHRLLRTLRRHQAACPKQRLVLLGGDVHVGAAALLDWGNGLRPSYELIASALSNTVGFPLKKLLQLAQRQPKVTIDEEGVSVEMGLLPAAAAAGEDERTNPYGGLNVGVLEVERISDDESSVRLLLIGCSDDDEPRPKVVFDSGRL